MYQWTRCPVAEVIRSKPGTVPGSAALECLCKWEPGMCKDPPTHLRKSQDRSFFFAARKQGRPLLINRSWMHNRISYFKRHHRMSTTSRWWYFPFWWHTSHWCLFLVQSWMERSGVARRDLTEQMCSFTHKAHCSSSHLTSCVTFSICWDGLTQVLGMGKFHRHADVRYKEEPWAVESLVELIAKDCCFHFLNAVLLTSPLMRCVPLLC